MALSEFGVEMLKTRAPIGPERVIETAWNHGQVHGPMSIIAAASSPYTKRQRWLHIEEADARLMAAAPELLAALQSVLAALPGSYSRMTDACAAARAAIAKATAPAAERVSP